MKRILFTAIALCLIYCSTTVSEEDPLKITLFYESYCPDCIQYIENQLSVVWKSLKAEFQVELVPFGNARQHWVDGHVKFECQHGPKECTGNKLHACAILTECGKAGTLGCAPDQLSHVINYVMCVERADDQQQASDKCARAEGMNPVSVMKCALNNTGDTLLSSYGNRTSAFRPKIRYVPTVAIDGNHDPKAENDLMGEICSLRPNLCKIANTETNLVFG